MNIKLLFDTEEFYLIPRIFKHSKYVTHARFSYVYFKWALSIDWLWFELNIWQTYQK